jgi:hypothetical protein
VLPIIARLLRKEAIHDLALPPTDGPRPAPASIKDAKAEPIAADDDMVSLYPVAMRIEQPHTRSLHRRRLAHEPQQDEADGRLAQTYHQLAEVRVLGQQHPTLRMGQLQNLIVAPPGISFGDIAYVVAGLPQQMDEIAVAAFVGQQPEGHGYGSQPKATSSPATTSAA